MKWESPRARSQSTRDPRHRPNGLYPPRRKIDGRLHNVEIDRIENVKDPVKERMKK